MGSAVVLSVSSVRSVGVLWWGVEDVFDFDNWNRNRKRFWYREWDSFFNMNWVRLDNRVGDFILDWNLNVLDYWNWNGNMNWYWLSDLNGYRMGNGDLNLSRNSDCCVMRNGECFFDFHLVRFDVSESESGTVSASVAAFVSAGCDGNSTFVTATVPGLVSTCQCFTAVAGRTKSIVPVAVDSERMRLH